MGGIPTGMPAVDAELNRDVFPPGVPRGSKEPRPRRNYVPMEQQTINSIPTSEENIVNMLRLLRAYESVPTVADIYR